MDKILEQVKSNIYSNDLIENGDRIVIGVSGGPDSVFLLHALIMLKEIIKKEKNIVYDICVAHVNHMIREEAKFDANLVKQMANKHNVEFHILEFDIVSEAKRLKIGTEECGRNVRYEFFKHIKQNTDSTKIAVAHNAGDNVETIMLNFIRGAGIKGLCGMEYKNNDIIRPLLNIDKEEILEYLNAHNINYAIDKTNLTNDYNRNKIRNDLIKKIETEYNPNFISVVNRMAQINKLDIDIIEQAVDEQYKKLDIKKKDGKIMLDISQFNKNTQGMRYQLARKILIELMGNIQGVEMIHIKDTCKLIEKHITRKQYVLGNKYKVIIENKNMAVFVNNM